MSMTTQNAPTCFILVLSEQVIHVHFSASDGVCDLQFQTKPPPPPPRHPTRYLTPTPNEPQALLLDLDRVEWDSLKFHSSDCSPPPLLFEVLSKWLPPPPPPPSNLSAHHHGLVPNYWKLCESRGGRPGLSVLTSLLVSVDIKLYWTVLRHWSQLVPNMSTDIRGH